MIIMKERLISVMVFSSLECSDHNIARNNLIYNETIGIDLSQSSYNEVYGNKIYGTTRGIYLSI